MRTEVTLCILLLPCISLCMPFSKYCRCVNTVPAVKWSQIASVEEYGPRSYCRRHEVIVTLKNKMSLCLNPNNPHTKRLLKRNRQGLFAQAA